MHAKTTRPPVAPLPHFAACSGPSASSCTAASATTSPCEPPRCSTCGGRVDIVAAR
ncbi:MAG: hypothetical protein WCP73_02990 [Eubacteriales bacterium]